MNLIFQKTFVEMISLMSRSFLPKFIKNNSSIYPSRRIVIIVLKVSDSLIRVLVYVYIYIY